MMALSYLSEELSSVVDALPDGNLIFRRCPSFGLEALVEVSDLPLENETLHHCHYLVSQ